ncbi:MAG: hypothetical protein QG633_617 [Patescibacteria group bacterium]|nr:hypothetical protein [Patescibacteria group bacterium]
MNVDLPPDVIEHHNKILRVLGIHEDRIDHEIDKLKTYLAETLEEIDRSHDLPRPKAALRKRITKMYKLGIRILETQRLPRTSA